MDAPIAAAEVAALRHERAPIDRRAVLCTGRQDRESVERALRVAGAGHPVAIARVLAGA